MGERIRDALSQLESSQVLKDLVEGAGALTVGAARVGLSQAAGIIGRVLLSARDDQMATFDIDVEADEVTLPGGKVLSLSSPRAEVQLTIKVR